MKVNEAIIKIQTELKCNKSKFNSFANFSYRSCEDILEALKPLLKETETYLICNTSMNMLCEGRFYIEVEATLYDKEGGCISATGIAREAIQPKAKMDESQATGSALTYAKKYALSNLFAIDDSLDADVYSGAPEGQKTQNKAAPVQQEAQPRANPMDILYGECVKIAKEHKAIQLIPALIKKSYNKNRFHDMTYKEAEAFVKYLPQMIADTLQEQAEDDEKLMQGV